MKKEEQKKDKHGGGGKGGKNKEKVVVEMRSLNSISLLECHRADDISAHCEILVYHFFWRHSLLT